jgi:hypothetical protein
VNRRYNQFKMLDESLSKSIALPAALPPRKLTGNLDAEFVAQRRCLLHTTSFAILRKSHANYSSDHLTSTALEAYLEAIVRDPVVINAKEFRAFIDSNLDASSRCLQSPVFSLSCAVIVTFCKFVACRFLSYCPAAHYKLHFRAVVALAEVGTRGTTAMPSAARFVCLATWVSARAASRFSTRRASSSTRTALPLKTPFKSL